MAGTLYLVPTPIGNLNDISPRCARTLAEADFIAAEDTRVSLKLLNHLEIKKSLVSYHEHNKAESGSKILVRLLAGETCALVTDAGSPAISDPGEDLVRICYESGIEVTSLPGACACVTALTLSGLPTRRFCFEAFLPREKKERAAVLDALKTETRTIILYEAPHHLKKTLAELLETLGDRKLTLCRELTKKHETVKVTTLSEAIAYYEENEPRGEYVLVLDGKSMEALAEEARQSFEAMSLEEHMTFYEEQGIPRKDAMKLVAKDRGVSKRDIYNALL